MGGSELGKERDRALEMRNRAVVPARGGVKSAEAELGRRCSAWFAGQRLEETPALLEIACFDQCVGEPDTGGQIVRGRGQRLSESDRSLLVPRKALEHERVEVMAFQAARRERLATCVGLVRALPLFPGMQHFRERTHRGSIGRSRRRVLVDARDCFTGRRWVRVKGQTRKWRQCPLRRSSGGEGGERENYEEGAGMLAEEAAANHPGTCADRV